MKKRILTMLLAVIMSVTQLPVSVLAENSSDTANIMKTFYVSVDGDDSAAGTSENPFRTLEKAKQAVNEVNDNMNGDIVVYLGDGTWELEKTLEFTSEDSGTNGFDVRYEAAPGAEPIISGGQTLENPVWTEATEVNWLQDGLKAYKTSLTRNDKLRAIYVDGERAAMTRKTLQPVGTVGNYSVTAGQADWAWKSGSGQKTGNVFNSSDLPADTPNPQNIELESGSTWVKALVCADALESAGDGKTQVNFQMPYAAIAQNMDWGTGYNPGGTNDVVNVFEFLEEPGEFYFDQGESTLYYIPREGENLDEAEIIIPRVEKLVDITGDTPLSSYAQNIVFRGIHFAYSDWNLYELDGSHGNATVQAATINTKYAEGNWHNDIYRAYDVPAAAIVVNSAKNIRFLDGTVSNTGYLGIHLENDVWNCEISGNKISHTGGAGIVIGHPQHVYENDEAKHQVNPAYAGPDKEKFAKGTESVPKHILISNNYLLENCYFFPGNAPITSFYTYDMQVLHNFIYKCSYSAMSIGWGWCEFDGYTGSDNYGPSKLPGIPSTTSRKNTISDNRIEEICSILHDGGGIYTLGQQGNEDWTDVTEMNRNYINAKREPQVADGSRMVNGFHPDEGSAYIKMDANVVTNIIRNVYELNNWKRKHHVIVTDGFSNTSRSETTAPDCTVELKVDETYTWNKTGYSTVLNSGLENEYVHLIGKDVIADTEYELASNVKLTAGDKLQRRGLLDAADTVWLAPEGTTAFEEGAAMTKAAGNAKEMEIPAQEGAYKLYIVYKDGSPTAVSQNTLYVGEARQPANVTEGMEYPVSALKPLKLSLDTDSYRFTLNDQPIENGYSIDEKGTWTLKAFEGDSEEAKLTIRFTTNVTEANQLLSSHVWAKPGSTLQLEHNLNDASKTIWLAPTGVTAFDKNDPSMTCISGDQTSITVPETPGLCDLTVVSAEGTILSRSDATVKVTDETIPLDYTLRLAADAGITADSQGVISEWVDAADSQKKFTPEKAGPVMQKTDGGMPYVSFNGKDQSLSCTGMNLNDKSEMTVILMALPDETGYTNNEFGSASGDRYCAVYANEAAGWSGMYVSPYAEWVGIRFGSTRSGCQVTWKRSEEMTVPSVTAAVKNGTVESIYVDGEKVTEKTDQAETTKGIGDKLYIGNSIVAGQPSYFCGRLYEVLIYDRVLTDDELKMVSSYLTEKYSRQIVKVSGVTLDQKNATMTEGDTLTLKAAVTPENASNQNVTWNSSDPEVVTVQNGKVTAVKPGTARVTVTTEDGAYTASCEIKVLPKDTEAPVIIGAENGTISCGGMIFTVEDDDLDTLTVNGETLTSDADGKYHIEGNNENPDCTIIATDKAGNKTTCTVKIYAGHAFTKYVSNNDATTSQNATESAHCDHGCGATDTREIPDTKLPEDEDSDKPETDNNTSGNQNRPSADDTERKDDTGSDLETPETGDCANGLLWLLLAAASVIAVGIVRKKQRDFE